MKLCPACRSTYTDDTLLFCLQDGTALVQVGAPTTGAVTASNSAPTLILSTVDTASQQTVEAARARETVDTVPRVRPASSGRVEPGRNTALIVVLTALTLAILVAVGVGVFVIFLRERRGDTPLPVNANSGQQNLNLNAGSPATSPRNANPGPTPPPAVPQRTVDVAQVSKQVTDALNGWAAASRAKDIDTHMSYYAAELSPYYRTQNYSASKLRAERARVYALYNTLDVELDNIKVTPADDGATATVVLDKTWTFESDAKFSSGSVQQQLWLKQVDGHWLITGEKDLKVYYVNSR